MTLGGHEAAKARAEDELARRARAAVTLSHDERAVMSARERLDWPRCPGCGCVGGRHLSGCAYPAWRARALADEALDRINGAPPIYMRELDGPRWRYLLRLLRWRLRR